MSENDNGSDEQISVGGRRNLLDYGKILAFGQWMGSKAEKLAKDRMPYDEAAAQASKDLGFPVSEGNVRSMARSMNVTWKAAVRGRKTGASNLWDAVRASESKLDEAAKLIEQLLLDNQTLHGKVGNLEAQLAQVRGSIVTIVKLARLNYVPPFSISNGAPKTPVANK